MRFRCSNCGTDYQGHEDNALLFAGRGFAHLPWFRDERGLNINATLCLNCGTLHATSGSPGKALLTLGKRMLKVHFYMPPDRIERFLTEGEVGIPQAALDLLVERGHLAATTDERVGGAPASAGAAGPFEALQRAYAAATVKYALYCQMVRSGEASVGTLSDFIAEGNALIKEGNRSTHATSAQVLDDALSAGISPTEVVEAAKAMLDQATRS